MSVDESGFHPVFWELHQGLPRQGPGSNSLTAKAYRSLGKLPEQPRIVDVGCGPGMQTLELARLSGSVVTAVDNHAPYLQELRDHAAQAHITQRVQVVLGSMFALPFAPASVDLFWAEGSIYIMGFEAGLRAWRPLLQPGGHIALTEATWIKADPPETVARFWEAGYPAMTTVDRNIRMAESCGYRVLDHFTLPPEAWWIHYYTPIEERLPEFRRRYAHDAEALVALDSEEEEIELFRNHGEHYGYVFYVLQCRDDS